MDGVPERAKDGERAAEAGQSRGAFAQQPELFLSEATVKTYVSRLLTKLELRDRVQVAVLAYESGLVQPGE
jgi:DNA-binding NarL/FixJ family response regulator